MSTSDTEKSIKMELDTQLLSERGNSPQYSDSVTVIAFVNFKSGGRKGDVIIHVLQRELGVENVFNLGDGNPDKHIEKFRNTPNLRIIACGGDGTVNWILSTVTRLNFENPPRVGLIPLGTGNDTSRHFGWGHKLRSEKAVVENVRRIKDINCNSVQFDRWQVFISVPQDRYDSLHPFLRGMALIDRETYINRRDLLHPQHQVELGVNSDDITNPVEITLDVETDRSLNRALSSSQQGAHEDLHLFWSFNNYFSFGIDAQIMDSFHRHRERSPGCYCCRCCTMTWVGLWSPINCCSCNKLPLRMDVDVLVKQSDVNDTSVTTSESVLPGYVWVTSTIDAEELNAFILLNLPSYAGGRNIWGTDLNDRRAGDRISAPKPPSSSDGQLEVLGFDSYTHMSTTVLQLGSRAHRLNQVEGIRFNIKDNIYVQLDGEAWTQDCGTIEIYRAPSTTMLLNEPRDTPGACCDC